MIARQPHRVVSLSPTATEMLFAVGAGPQVVALARQAPVLLIDEPTTALDVGRQREVLEILAEPVIAEHYGAHVRVIELIGSGKAVVPVRR